MTSLVEGELAQLWIEGAVAPLSVRGFAGAAAVSTPWRWSLTARSPHAGLDLDAHVGARAAFTLHWGGTHRWRGRCSAMTLARVDDDAAGLATYTIEVVPELWRLSQRVNCRLFQHQSAIDIVDQILSEWELPRRWEIDRARHPRLELRTQYGESDLDFVGRILEEAGITYWLEPAAADADGAIVLSDAPTQGKPRTPPLPFTDEPTAAQVTGRDYCTALEWSNRSRPGRVTLRDHDFRRLHHPGYVSTARGEGIEQSHEQYRFDPCAFRQELPEPQTASMDVDPVGDDLGVSRHVMARGRARAELMREGLESDRRRLTFSTHAADLHPGAVVQVIDHPHPGVVVPVGHLVLRSTFRGEIATPESWDHRIEAVPADAPYRPLPRHRKPRIAGLHPALVVGRTAKGAGQASLRVPAHAHFPGAVGSLSAVALDPDGATRRLVEEDIYVDEHARVRVQLPWDREHGYDSESSIWMRVSQAWAGNGYGMLGVPRVGHEVLVGFVDGDPDLPVVVGRMHNRTHTHHPLPANATVTAIKTASAPATGGANELRFDDAAGREHVFLQAERDLDQLVKNDLKQAVGGHRTHYVQRSETTAVGRDRTSFVNFNEQMVTGLNAHRAVGVNRTTTVGSDDSTVVGGRWSVTMGRGLVAELPRQIERAAQSLGGVLRSAATEVLGRLPQNPLANVAGATLTEFGARAWEQFRDAAHLLGGFEAEPGPPPTAIEMVDRQIKLSTGEASIVLDGPNVTISAQGGISLHALESVTVLSEREIAIAGTDRVAVMSADDDVVVQANRDLHLNPYASSPSAPRGMKLGETSFAAEDDAVLPQAVDETTEGFRGPEEPEEDRTPDDALAGRSLNDE